MATSYTNPCGSGDRRTLVLVTSAVSYAGTLTACLDGNTTTNAWFFNTATGNVLEFWFPSKKVIDEATWYQQNTAAHGTWKWQGSHDRTTWTDIGGSFTLGGVATQTLTSLAGNTTGYVFYRLFQVSGAASTSPWIYEIAFKVDEAGTTSYLNPLGSGNRTGAITVTSSGISWFGTPGTPATLVNGSFALSELFWDAVAVAGHWVRFDLGTPVVVQQARFWLDRTLAQGDWKLQGSPDGSAWTDLSAVVTLGNTVALGPFVTCFGGGESNATAYRYYRLLGVSGSRSTSPWELEVEFLVAVVSTPAVARVTQAVSETLSRPVLPAARVTQAVIEILQLIPPPPDTRVTQAVTELLTRATSTAVTQALLELLTPVDAIPVRLTQLAVDVFLPAPAVSARLTQAAVEAFTQVPGRARATQLVVEVFLRPLVCITGAFPVDDAAAGGSCPARPLP